MFHWNCKEQWFNCWEQCGYVDMDVITNAIAYMIKPMKKKKKHHTCDGHHFVRLLQEDLTFFSRKVLLTVCLELLPSLVMTSMRWLDEKSLGTRHNYELSHKKCSWLTLCHVFITAQHIFNGLFVNFPLLISRNSC